MKTEQTNMRNYKEIAGGLGTSDYWKPLQGKHTVVFLGEPVPDSYQDAEGNITPQERFSIEVERKPFQWTIPVGKTTRSLYGQLMLLAASRATILQPNGYFTGTTATIIVKGDGKNKDYTVEEAINIKMGDIKL